MKRWNILGAGAVLRLALCVGVLALAGCSTSPPVAITPHAPAPHAPAPDAATTSFVYGTGVWLADRLGDQCTLALRGALDEGAVRRVEPALQWVEQAGCSRKTLLLQARVGVVNEAMTLGAMVRNRGYDTQVAASAACTTPCMLAFAAGTQRWMTQTPAPAQLLFTQIPADGDFGQRLCQSQWSRGQQLTLMRYLRAMLPAATAQAVFVRLQAADCNSSVSYGPTEALALGLATGVR